MIDTYMLISVCDREILTRRLKTLEKARNTMHEEMRERGLVPEDAFDVANGAETDKYGFGEMYGWANDGIGHADFDWQIVSLGGCNEDS